MNKNNNEAKVKSSPKKQARESHRMAGDGFLTITKTLK